MLGGGIAKIAPSAAPLRLSICVPSRNRQIYFQETIRALTASPRNDVEFVFADNSDDPSIMNQFMEQHIADPRVVYIPSGDRVFSMVDNWERTVAASTGDWISVIGDDDYLDPEVVVLLQRLVTIRPQLEAFDWTKLHFTWPEEDDGLGVNVTLSMRASLVDVSPELNRRRAWLWEEATYNLVNGFSIYHAALSRSLLERIKQRFGGRYFEHPTVDFDSSFKVSLVATDLLASERPFSVLGSCPLSNSGSAHTLEGMRILHEKFMADLGRNLDEDSVLADMPFRSDCGVSAAVAQVQHWIKKRYGLNYEGWESNFTACCQRSCERIAERTFFDQTVERYKLSFARWQGGKYLPFFNPQFSVGAELSVQTEPFSGILDGQVYVSLKLLNPRTPADLFHVASGVMASAEDIDLKWFHMR